MTTLFISDLHIDSTRPAITEQFLSFLSAEAVHATALYILGDLFESWVGDDSPDAAQSATIAGLRALTGSGVPCFVLHGNRDFLLGADFCKASGASLLSDPLIATLYGERVLVTHGDALCTDDRSYQRLRATMRDEDWRRGFAALPPSARRTIADAARAGSQAHTAAVSEKITDVNPETVAIALRAAHVNLLLHGHTHRPGIHAFDVDGRPCTRIVLGDWYEQGSVLRWDEEGPELASLQRR